ncbi:PREDICTED: uncharacterized protein LOC109587263 [Amphimedon queenslandica]|uniref:Death domain-containing protein n=1 Tax=Amphimedon queenslandica TaxID=400682 RepID=A0A1X7TKJ8_AMPQE|nr:PREDICTED: uncharacterized protein LOC109587263 [Amphimedon queenslandica]|eukprot:XP_019859060.1 PREDICTED: uncharacterized protein LOC109587263 [Amphimedon queenslandica]
MSAWLRGKDKVREKGGPSWSSLAIALDKEGKHHIATNIRNKYCLDIKEVVELTEEFKAPLTPIKLEPTIQKVKPATNYSPTQISEYNDDQQKVILTIRDLVGIVQVLKDSSFQTIKWFDLGLYLGLTYNNLKMIEIMYPRDAEQCLRECLAKWLTDIEATWDKLAIAVSEVGETSVAEYIRAEVSFASAPTMRPTVQPTELDELKGVHVAAINSFLIHGGSTQSVNWEEYGIKITIPQGAVLPSDTVQVTITALVGGDFIFPEDTELVSAVYAINLSKPFLKPVKLEIQHCVSIETSSHCNYLSFATATNNQPPYKFITVDGGEFSIGNRYGSISIAKFSKYCIKTYSGRRYQPYSIPGPSSYHERTHTLSSLLLLPTFPVFEASSMGIISVKNSADKLPNKSYYGQVMYEVRRPGREWLMRFLLSKDLNALIEHIKKTFKFVECIEVSFQFKDDDGFIELYFDYGQCPKGWSVRPHQFPTGVRQIDIDDYGSMSPPRFPKCLITFTVSPGEDTVKELSYPVTMQGIKKSNVEKINIVLTMGDFQQASAGSIASNTGPISSDDERKLAGKVLRENFAALSKILAAPSNLSAVIMSFYAKELISDTTATECMNDCRPVQDRCASLLFAVKATVDGKPQLINTLIEALKENEAFKEIADKMTQSLINP